MTDNAFNRISPDVKLGRDVVVHGFANLYGCEIGDESRIGTFVEIQQNVRIGRCCKISSHTFICEGVAIEDRVFIGHNVTFINDRFPRATRIDGGLQTSKDWQCVPTRVCSGASIGSGATVLCGVTVGSNAMVGAGSVVTRDVAPHSTVAGNPARPIHRSAPAEAMAGKILFNDLAAQHRPIRDKLIDAITEVMDDGTFIGGAVVSNFEEAFARYCGVRHAVAVASGSEALLLTLLALNIGPGDEVITAPNTFIATAEAIKRSGATPVFVDVCDDTATMDPARLNAAITPATRAIIPVHLFGQPADVDSICEIARQHGLIVIEDACQAHGSLYKGRKAGALADAGCFSFFPSKNLGALGDAGAIVTQNEELSERLRALRNHGQKEKNQHEIDGWTARMDAIQAAVLAVKLQQLDTGNSVRRERALLYNQLLAEVPGVSTPVEAPYAHHNYHLYVIRTTERDRLVRELAAHQIDCPVHYPTPIHLQPSFRYLNLPTGSFPVAEALAQQSLSLPMHPELSTLQVEHICRLIADFHSRIRSENIQVA